MLLSEVIVIEYLGSASYLYHASDAATALQIIHSGKLKDFTRSRVPGRTDQTGVSLTRSSQYAHTGADDAGRRSAKVGGNTIGTDVVFIFDSNVLGQMKKKIPVSQSMGKNAPDQMTKGSAQTEYEEFVHGELPLDKRYGYIGFYINNRSLDRQLAYQLSTSPGFLHRSPNQTAQNDAREKMRVKNAPVQQAPAQQVQSNTDDDEEDDWDVMMAKKQAAARAKQAQTSAMY